ncbi:peptidoglycan-binding protein [Lachnoclostridium sp. MSJ-17]|uniref:peptidoglycan-binding protein n=1 Tax=Lachnoclostridium sp. MSJ-17 TaxID=2841516 RepID=UPI001C118D9F|nr:peptidoglycan-binding protein [Lachnoclostridium sp. MSJ-17]MBU5462748.1 peptidoglycan-binding protein [Lachnoclostridium sp. MSJ-17]
MHRIKKLTAVILSTLTVSSVCVFGGLNASASGTGAGLAEYCLNAYDEGWSYVWGGTTPGAVDCSGLIWSYCGGNRMSMLSDAQENGRDWGYVSNGVPRVHGLGLSRPGHVGVYIEDGMEVDARGDDYGVCYQEIGGWNNWDCWFKLTAVTYPENGWEEFNGNYYYYEDGEYIVNTSREIDGTTYYFDSKGHSGTTPSDTSSTVSSSSNSGSSKSSTSLLRYGSSGSEVEKIQKRLSELGFYDGAIDGDFGRVTEQAYRAFQEAAGVTVDGISGSDREVLYSDEAPRANVKNTDEEKTEDTAADTADITDDNDKNTDEVGAVEETKPEETVEAAEDQKTEVEAETKPEAPVMGDFTDAVYEMQSKLYELGYFGIEPTGFFGDYTADAIKAFQLCNGLEVTGEMDEATAAAMNSDDAVYNPNVLSILNEDVAGPEYVDTYDSAQSEYTPATADSASAFAAGSSNSNGSGNALASSSNTVDKTNKAADKALQSAASAVPDGQTAQIKRAANIWIWLVLTIIVISAVALIFLRKTTRKPRTAKKSTKAALNTRW